MYRSHILIVALLLSLVACGGSGSGGTSPNLPPSDTQAPSVTINYPANNAIIASTKVNIQGTVDDPAAEVRINGDLIVNTAGSFEVIGYEMPNGAANDANTLQISATDTAGNVGSASIVVQVDQLNWLQSYDAGYSDLAGAWAGGSEIMHLVPHKGLLYAANGYWETSRWEQPAAGNKQSAQVLRLDGASEDWQIDLDMGTGNDVGADFMKGNILESVTFTVDGDGLALPSPVNMLVMSSGNLSDRVSVWVRNDTSGDWVHEAVQTGTATTGVRWVPRDIQIYRDKVSNIERIFLVLGNPGIISGVFDASQASGIRWDNDIEFPVAAPFTTRPLGITEANGKLYFSVGGVIFQRNDGPVPTYREVLNMGGGVNTDVGGIRGLTTVVNPNGVGDSMLFVWAPNGNSIGAIKRLDPDGSGSDGFGGYTMVDEANLSELMSNELGVAVPFTLGPHNQFYPFTDPVSGDLVHFIGFLGRAPGMGPLLWEGELYAGAMYAIRKPDQTYSVHEVNNQYAPNKAVLVAPRAFALSPFGDDQIYVGGHDASFFNSDDMAWVFRADRNEVLLN